MNLFGYSAKRILKQYTHVILALIIVPVILFVPPEGWFPGTEFIPNFWKQKGLWQILTEYQMIWPILGFITTAILVMYWIIKAIK